MDVFYILNAVACVVGYVAMLVIAYIFIGSRVARYQGIKQGKKFVDELRRKADRSSDKPD